MCWSPEASLTLGVAGVATVVYASRKGTSTDMTAPLFYFSLMEFIQFFGYSQLNQCALPANQWLTMLSYAHIVFQPIFFNMLYMNFLATPISRKMRRFVYAVSLFMSALLLVKVIPLVPESMCRVGQTLCSTAWCSVSGDWHLAWNIPWYTWPLSGDIILYYLFAVLVVPLFYGAWRGVLFALIGPILAFATTQNPNEWPAVWCLFSVGLILLNLAVSKFTGHWPYKK